MVKGRGGRGSRGVAGAALAALVIGMTACAISSPTAPQTAGLDKWDGEPVVENHQSCAAGQTGPACAPIRASAP